MSQSFESFDEFAQRKPVLSPQQFDLVRDVLARYSGVYLDNMNQRMLTNGIGQRLLATRLVLDDYIALLLRPSGRVEVQHLIELVLNHETIFFRNQAHMRAMREEIVPELHRRLPSDCPLRIWSAGCATGEEPYSLAMMVLESLGRPLPRPVEIWGTDLSMPALERAQRGLYRGRVLSNVTPELKMRHFVYQGEGWSLKPHVRNLVHFAPLNLLDPFPDWTHGVHVIFCQNVTIYFQLETFRRLVTRFYDLLPEDGMLFLGFSETLWNVFDKFRLREVQGAFVYVKQQTGPARPAPAAQLPPPTTQPRAAVTTMPRPAPSLPRRPKQARQRTQSTRPLGRATQPPELTPPAQPPPEPTPGSPHDMLARGQALLAAGKANAVLDLLDQVPLDGDHAPHVLTLVARAHANRGDIDLAIAEARRAIELDTLTLDAYLLLGVLHVQQGQVHEGVQYLERARYLEPASALVSYHLAEAYRQLGRAPMAVREYRNTLRKLAEHPPDIVLDGVAVGWIRATCERYIRQLEAG